MFDEFNITFSALPHICPARWVSHKPARREERIRLQGGLVAALDAELRGREEAPRRLSRNPFLRRASCALRGDRRE